MFKLKSTLSVATGRMILALWLAFTGAGFGALALSPIAADAASGGVNYELWGPTAGQHVVAVDESNNVAVTLVGQSDGAYRGFEFRNLSNLTGFYLHYEVNGARTEHFFHWITPAERSAHSAFQSYRVAAKSEALGGTVAYPGRANQWTAKYSDSFGGIAIAVATLDFTYLAGPETRLSIGRITYDMYVDCIRLTPSNNPNCVPRSAGGTLSNPYLTVDVQHTYTFLAGTPNTVRYVNWAFTMSEAAANHTYIAITAASDISRANLPWQSLSTPVGVTHQPAAVTVTPHSGSLPTNSDTAFIATFRDADGATDLDTVYLTFATGVGVAYNRQQNRMYISADSFNVSTSLPGCTPNVKVKSPATNSLATTNAILDCASSSVTASGGTLTVVWYIAFTTAASGHTYSEFLRATDVHKGDTGWVATGSVAVR